jgi:hypothetical protein
MSPGAQARAAILAAAETLRRDAARDDPTRIRARLTAIVWATVDLDRAERELGAILGAPLAAVGAARDPTLGATVRIAQPFGQPPEPALLLVEPDTEGRLAALLARHGEGVVGIEVQSDGAVRRIELTSGPGGPPPPGPSDRPPEAPG